MKVEQTCAEAQRASRVLAGLAAGAQGRGAVRRRRRAARGAPPRSWRRTTRTSAWRARTAWPTRSSTGCFSTRTGLRDVESAVRDVAALPDPVGELVDGWRLDNGVELRKVRVPLGVIAVIYEARPNVTVDAAALCLKTGNAVILRGGSAALHIQPHPRRGRAGGRHRGRPAARGRLVPRPGPQGARRAAQAAQATSTSSSRAAARTSRTTCSSTARCRSSTPPAATATSTWTPPPTSTRRCPSSSTPSASGPASATPPRRCSCTSDVAAEFLPRAAEELKRRGVELVVDKAAARPHRRPALKRANKTHYDTEFLALKLAVRVVDSLDEALEHIATYGTRHSEAIVTEDLAAARRFTARGRRGLRLRQRLHPVHRRRRSSAWAPRWASPRRSCTSAARSPCRSSPASSTSCGATGRCGARRRGTRRGLAWASSAGASTRRTSPISSSPPRRCRALGLERVLFVPAAAPPHKGLGERTSAEVRLEMTSLAVDDDLRFTASGIEIERGLVYTARHAARRRHALPGPRPRLHHGLGLAAAARRRGTSPRSILALLLAGGGAAAGRRRREAIAAAAARWGDDAGHAARGYRWSDISSTGRPRARGARAGPSATWCRSAWSSTSLEHGLYR